MFRTAFDIDRASAGLDLGNTHDKACAVGESGCEDARVGAVLLKAELFAVVGPADALYLCIDAVEVLPAGIRLFDGNACIALDSKTVYVSVAAVAAAKHEILADTVDTAWLRFVESISGASDPAADSAEESLLHLRYRTASVGTDVEKVVRTDLAAGAERFYKLGQGFVIEIVSTAAPMIVHRLAHLGGEIFRHALAVHRLGASLLEGHAVKLDVSGVSLRVQPRIVYDYRIGLMAADHLVKLVFLPIRVLLAPVSVEPQSADLAVI